MIKVTAANHRYFRYYEFANDHSELHLDRRKELTDGSSAWGVARSDAHRVGGEGAFLDSKHQLSGNSNP